MIEEKQIAEVCAIAREAGEAIMAHYKGARQARAKADNSPVTDADIAAHDIIVARLRVLTPDIPIISEEDKVNAALHNALCFWVIDPLDGTRAFVKGEDEFTVNIALVEGEYPIFGVLYLPVERVLYYGSKEMGAYKEEKNRSAYLISVRKPGEKWHVVRSYSKPSPQARDYLNGLPKAAITHLSSALKFGLIAEGAADHYPRFGRTMEWDTAAGQAILEAAGGSVRTVEGERLKYRKPGFENPPFIARGK